MKIIVGLGNPGKEYEKTHHNLGFLTLDHIAKELGLSFSKKQCDSLTCETRIGNEKIVLCKPQTFMNLSGTAVQKIARKFKLQSSDIVVVCDDVDLDLGVVRYRQNGSGGTHNGLKNIVECLGDTNFQRIKIGIGRDSRVDLADYVLSKISKENEQTLETAIANAATLALSKVGRG